jgi:hypothetical protein
MTAIDSHFPMDVDRAAAFPCLVPSMSTRRPEPSWSASLSGIARSRQRAFDEVCMIAFEISIDGRNACTAGVSPAGVTSVIATWVRRPARDPASGDVIQDRFEEELTLDVGGLTHDPDGALVHLRWLRQALRPGQRVTLTVVDTEAADPPQSREREDPTRAAERKREYYERLKREYGEA